MRLMAFGGDLRMDGAVLAARRAGWETQHIRSEEDKLEWESADAVLLPWPHSFREGMLVGTAMRKEETLARLPLCSVASYGAGVRADELPRAEVISNAVKWAAPSKQPPFVIGQIKEPIMSLGEVQHKTIEALHHAKDI